MKFRIIILFGAILSGCCFLSIKPSAGPISELQPTIQPLSRTVLAEKVTALNGAMTQFEGIYRDFNSAIGNYSQYIPLDMTNKFILDAQALRKKKTEIQNWLVNVNTNLSVNPEANRELAADIDGKLRELNQINHKLNEVYGQFSEQLSVYKPDLFAK